MKKIIVCLIYLTSFVTISAQKVSIVLFSRYVYTGNLARLEPTFNDTHTNIIGMQITYKKLNAEGLYLYNHTINRNGVMISLGYMFWKKSLKKGFNLGSQVFTEIGLLPTTKQKPQIFFQTLGLGLGIKKFLDKNKKLSISAKVPMMAKYTKTAHQKPFPVLEFRGIVEIAWKFKN